DICNLISQQMYGGQLVTADDRQVPLGPEVPKLIQGPLTIVDTSALWPFESRNAFGSRFNLLHALLVRNLLIHLRNSLFIDNNSAVGVCTPYSAQAKLLQKIIADA